MKEPAPDQKKSQPRRVEKEQEEAGEEEKDEEIVHMEDSEGLLDTITGKPVEEDNIIFALPVVAPYQVLHVVMACLYVFQVLSNYKYKVKLTPGTGKRGKAAKSAMELFLVSSFLSNQSLQCGA